MNRPMTKTFCSLLVVLFNNFVNYDTQKIWTNHMKFCKIKTFINKVINVTMFEQNTRLGKIINENKITGHVNAIFYVFSCIFIYRKHIFLTTCTGISGQIFHVTY